MHDGHAVSISRKNPMPDMKEINAQLEKALLHQSKFEIKRDYLSMSKLGNCPRAALFSFTRENVSDLSTNARMARVGYLIEADFRNLLLSAGLVKPDSSRELQSDFDQLVKGHTDGETVWDELYDIKSL